MRDKLRDLLSPHFGHLDFLMRIHKEEISYEDMSLLVNLIRDKSLTQYLHKELHSYNSYYLLMVELHFIKDNLKYIKFFKELTKTPRDIFLNILNNRSKFNRIRTKIDHIMNSDELTESFRRWSSRIKDEGYAITYTKSIKNKDTLDLIFNSNEQVIELKDYDSVIKNLPSAWCITDRQTFYRYINGQRIFLMKFDGNVYGVNSSDSNNGLVVTSIYDERNNNVRDSIIHDIAQETINRLALNDELISNKDEEYNRYGGPVRIPIKNPSDSIIKSFIKTTKKFFNKISNILHELLN